MASENRRAAWIEIDLQAVRENIRRIKAMAGINSVCAVIKANAYGHGAQRIAQLAAEEGCRMLAVATCDEAMELRACGCYLPVLVLSPMDKRQYTDAVANDIRITVFDMETALALEAAALSLGKQAYVHIAVDTGMSRIGVRPDAEGLALTELIYALPHLCCEGIYTHFAAADSADAAYTLKQIASFDAFLRQTEACGLTFAIRHACNSGGVIAYPQAYYDMVRPGISLYGYYPSEEVDRSALELSPALTLKARVTMVKEIEEGVCVGYGCKYRAAGKRRIATLPLGYADGLPYAYARGGEVLIGGRRAPIAGSICMDQLMVDVSDIADCRVGSEAVLLGRQGAECITPEEMAAKSHTIKYDILTSLNSRLHVQYVND